MCVCVHKGTMQLPTGPLVLLPSAGSPPNGGHIAIHKHIDMLCECVCGGGGRGKNVASLLLCRGSSFSSALHIPNCVHKANRASENQTVTEWAIHYHHCGWSQQWVSY